MGSDGNAAVGIGLMLESNLVRRSLGVPDDDPDERLSIILKPYGLSYCYAGQEGEYMLIGPNLIYTQSSMESSDYPITITDEQRIDLLAVAAILRVEPDIKFWVASDKG